jgi:hypothetical protein
METVMTKSTSELLADLNAIRTFEGKEPLAAWKKSRSDLEALLKTYENEPETEAEQEERLMEALGPVPELASGHVEALNEALDQMTDDMGLNQKLDLLSDVIPENDHEPEVPAETPAASEDASVTREKSPRGAIGIMVMDLLQTDMPYKDIVTKVRETYWDAKTTERSIASVAMDLRRDGVNVLPRRKPAAVKPLKSTAQVAPTAEEPSH